MRFAGTKKQHKQGVSDGLTSARFHAANARKHLSRSSCGAALNSLMSLQQAQAWLDANAVWTGEKPQKKALFRAGGTQRRGRASSKILRQLVNKFENKCVVKK